MKRRWLTPGRVIGIGFLSVIVIGAILLSLPVAHNSGVHIKFIDALFTSTSAVCVTGLITVDTYDSFSLFGRIVIAALIQIGGLGITSIGIGLIALASRKKMDFKKNNLIKEAFNYPTMKGIKELIRAVIIITLGIEFVGAIASFCVFIQDYPFKEALGISIFHSISAFNNAGFDILGGFKSLSDYQSNIALNLITSLLIILGGIGFFVIYDMIIKKSFKKYSLHTKVVLIVTFSLLVGGTVLLKITEGSNITWLGAFFNSVSSRTAGFSTFSLKDFSNASLLIMIILMFIGASPGSTGGGIKTTTFALVMASLFSTIRNRDPGMFKRSFPKKTIQRAWIVTSAGICLILVATILICIFEPEQSFLALLFEVVSAFATVGLSTGITPMLALSSKIVIIITMFCGRLGPLTIAAILINNKKIDVKRPEDVISIG